MAHEGQSYGRDHPGAGKAGQGDQAVHSQVGRPGTWLPAPRVPRASGSCRCRCRSACLLPQPRHTLPAGVGGGQEPWAGLAREALRRGAEGHRQRFQPSVKTQRFVRCVHHGALLLVDQVARRPRSEWVQWHPLRSVATVLPHSEAGKRWVIGHIGRVNAMKKTILIKHKKLLRQSARSQ